MPLLRRAVHALATGVLLAACGGAAGSPSITASDVRAPEPAGPNGAVHLTLRNDGDSDDRLVSAGSDVAGRVEIHESTMADGTMSMQQVDGVDIPAGGEAMLESGGLHIMLIDVREDLMEGDTFDLTLSFESSDDQTVTAEVVPLVP
jgi:hypothetical protein